MTKRKQKPTIEEWIAQHAMTEAMRQAMEAVKHQLKCEGKRPWDYSAEEIALRADALIDADREAAIARAVERLIRGYERL